MMDFIRRYWQGILITLAGGLTLALGYWGTREYFLELGQPRSPWTILYFVSFLFAIESGETQGPVPWSLEAARLLGVGIVFWAVIRTLLLLFRDRVQEMRPYFWRGHVVICGLGRKGLTLVEECRDNKNKVAVIEQDAQNPYLTRCRRLGAVVVIGNAADKELLLRTQAFRAADVIMVTGDDGVNVAAAVALHHAIHEKSANRLLSQVLPICVCGMDALKKRLLPEAHEGEPSRLTAIALYGVHRLDEMRNWLHNRQQAANMARMTTCTVHLVDPHLCELFKQHKMFRDESDRFDLHVFNTYENAARLLLAANPLEGDSARDFQKTPHLVILGFGKMGQSIALQTAKTAHYASDKPARVTIIDREATSLEQVFLGRYPRYSELCATQFIQADISSAVVIADLIHWARNPNTRLTVAVCLDEDGECLAAAMHLATQLREATLPIHVRMSEATGLASLFEAPEFTSEWLACIKPFALIRNTCRIDMVMKDKLDTLARAIHEAFRASQLQEEKPPSEQSRYPWERLAPIYRDSNRQQADHIPVKLRAIGCKVVSEKEPGIPVTEFTQSEMDLLARMEHRRWNAERFLAGWEKGECPREKKEEWRLNPHLVPWEELQDDIRDYDRQAVRQIPDLLKQVQEKIIRCAESENRL